MSEVYLDGVKLDYEDKDQDSTIGQMLEVVEEELLELKRVIMEVWVDDAREHEWRSPEFLGTPLSAPGWIKLVSLDIDSVALQGHETCQEYLSVIRGNMDAVVDKLRRGQEEEGLKVLASVFEHIAELIKTMEALYKSAAKYGIELFTQAPVESYSALTAQLQEVHAAQEAGDTVLIADLLEYEIVPLLDKLKGIFLLPKG